MKYVAGLLLMVSSLAYSPTFAADVSCECPKLGCDPCSIEKGITFFSDKCGPANSKIKSCARPTCVLRDTATKACPVLPTADSGPRAPIVISGDVPKEQVVLADEAPAAGRVKVIQGSVAIVHTNGKKTVVSGEADVREGETIESGKSSGAVVNFAGGNKVHVHADTELEVKEFKDQEVAASRKALLNLVKGKIRNQVEQRYNGKTSYYKIMTKGAVAGVRGTDFVVDHSENGKLETRIETLGGKVVLANEDGSASVEIKRGEGATYTAELGGADSEFVQRGRLSEVYKIPPDKLAELDRNSRLDMAARRVSSENAEICSKPAAHFNQCLWKCVGNPSGEKYCRTDLPQVRCVRSRCNANGEWAEETRQPASVGQAVCPPAGMTLKDCDY